MKVETLFLSKIIPAYVFWGNQQIAVFIYTIHLNSDKTLNYEIKWAGFPQAKPHMSLIKLSKLTMLCDFNLFIFIWITILCSMNDATTSVSSGVLLFVIYFISTNSIRYPISICQNGFLPISVKCKFERRNYLYFLLRVGF